MVCAKDYLNPSELRRLDEISSDREQLKRSLCALSAEARNIRQRGKGRLAAAQVATGPRL